MKKEDIIAKIVEFSAGMYKGMYDVVTNGEWDLRKLRKQWNLTLHIIWRELKHGMAIQRKESK